MNMKKKIFIVLIVVLMLSICLVSCSKDSSSQTLQNGNFEAIDPDSKVIESWTKSSGSTFTFINNKNDGSDQYQSILGTRYAKVSASSASYDYIYQTISLKKNTNYKITAYVKVESISPSNEIGFRIGFTNDSDFVGLNVKEVTTSWETREYYFISAIDGEATLTVGLGSAKNKASGTVFVDNVTLQEVSTIPAEFSNEVEVETLKNSSNYSLSTKGSTAFVVLLSIFTVLFMACMYFALKSALANKAMAIDDTKTLGKVVKLLTSDIALFFYAIGGAFVVRCLITILSYGMTNSIESLTAIASTIQSNGFISYYSKNAANVEAMGATYIYGILGYLANAMKLETASLGMSILMRTPQMLAELCTVYMLYSFALKHQNEKVAAVISCLYAFVPIFFIFGSLYASTVSIIIALMVAMFVAILDKNPVVASILYTCSVLVSYYSLVILPLMIAYFVLVAYQDKSQRLGIILTSAISFVLIFALGAILNWEVFKTGKIYVVFTKIYEFFKDMKYLSTDAFNLYSIFGLANTKERVLILELFNWFFVIGMNAWAIYMYIKEKNRLDLILNSSVMFAAYSILSAQGNIDCLPLAIILLLVYLVIVPENRLYILTTLLSTLSFLNIAQLASQSGYISQAVNATYLSYASKSAYLIVFSVIAVLSVAYYVYVVLDISYYNQASEITPLEGKLSNELKDIFKIKKNQKRV